MNEELQSTNEELQTLNDELHQRTEEANRANAFQHSIVSSLRSGAIVIDQNFNILVWNPRAEDLWGLRETEVQGRSLWNLDIGLPVDRLKAVIRLCFLDAKIARRFYWKPSTAGAKPFNAASFARRFCRRIRNGQARSC